MDDLFLGICLPPRVENRQRTRAVIRGGAPRGGNFALERVATLPQNRWQLSARTGGNFRVERVATFPQNTHGWQVPPLSGGRYRSPFATTFSPSGAKLLLPIDGPFKYLNVFRRHTKLVR